ncbi:uncharacterized protein N7459_003114 [Penicillium hispanicum]|uniref:uncharacterized protein n=1 Tax=Penicillium hispanicum TaxID=1080232 RepID=UPI002541656B|nr:uncharacterized protein N7459_003114 [Penicillium hispanicum]KAJ5587349.1 hypothetical protein N7459_003114 [Penicillium hispanicum]
MPPHLHPRSRSTTGLFAGTLLASLLVVGMPHVFPCPAPRRTFADSEMTITADGQQVPRIRRRRQKDIDVDSGTARPGYPTASGAVDEEVSTFYQMQEEAEKLSHKPLVYGVVHVRLADPEFPAGNAASPQATLNYSPSTIRTAMPWARFLYNVLTQPRHTQWVAPLLILGDAVLCALVIWKIPYTEIDWTTYMQHISLYVSGERDYLSITGSTGPLVYPAAHVYIYSLLYHLTDEGRDILLGQILFAALYLATLIVVVACYRQVQAPPFLFPLLVLSKRLHSIYMLRMFNDGVAAFAMWAAIYLCLKRKWTGAVAVWSLGVGVKMTLVLLVPAIAILTLLSVGLLQSIVLGATAVLIQVLLAVPFLQTNPIGYLSKAFELSRQFMFKWTVNWRFVGEETFLSRDFSVGLLVLHISLLAIFSVGWMRPSGSNMFRFLQDTVQGRQETVTLSKPFIMTVMLKSLAIGLLCARSLHYQFYAYLAWASPFLFWRTGLHPLLIFVAWAAQEWAWNVYPSTNSSSAVVVLSLALQVFGLLLHGPSELDSKRGRAGDRRKAHSQ